MKFRDSVSSPNFIPFRRCAGRDRATRATDDFSLQVEDVAERLGEPTATYDAAGYIFAVDKSSGTVKVYKRPVVSRTTDTRPLSAQLHDLNERNKTFWERQS